LRAGPLSDEKVVRTLNAHFACVFTSNEDYFADTAAVAKDELAELQRIHREGYAAKMSVGTVHAYLLSPDGKLQESLHVAEAAKEGKLLQALERVVAKFGTPSGKPLATPVALSRPRNVPPGSVAVHITARREDRGSWGEFPGENWPVFSADEWRAFVSPPPGGKPGDKWPLDAALCRRLLNHFHPQTEDCSDKDRNHLQTAALTAELQNDGSLRLNGKMELRRAFYPGRKDLLPATATIAGFCTPDRFTIVTLDDARFGKEKFFAAAVAHIGGASR
jgi:hypothetical protein